MLEAIEFLVARGNGVVWALMLALLFFNVVARLFNWLEFDQDCEDWLTKHKQGHYNPYWRRDAL